MRYRLEEKRNEAGIPGAVRVREPGNYSWRNFAKGMAIAVPLGFGTTMIIKYLLSNSRQTGYLEPSGNGEHSGA